MSVVYIVNIHGALSYWKQGALGAAVSGVRRVWAAGGLQHEYSWRPQLLEARHAGCCRPGLRHVWAGAGLQCTGVRAYRGGCLPTSCLLCLVI